jgi:NADH-quinone oxidoreductase subunit M
MFLNKFFKEIIFFISSLLLLICSLLYSLFYNSSEASFQFLIELNWFESYYLLGIDSISVLFLFLTTFIMPICLLFNWNQDKSLTEQYYFFFILLFLEVLLLILVFFLLMFLFQFDLILFSICIIFFIKNYC